MLRTTTLFAGAALALGIGGLATPALAEGAACDLNNGPPPVLTASSSQLYCGNQGSFVQAPNQTAVGQDTGIADADTTVVGTLANASGQGATAVGEQSFANLLGFFFSGTLPSGTTSTALGQGAISIGLGTIAIGDHSFVGLLNGSQVTGVQDSTAVGSNSTVTADNATAVGFGSTATAAAATAIGQGSSATAANSVAMGAGSSATAAGATAIGQGSSATAANSVAIGAGSVADQANTVSVGSAGNERRITNVAAGVNATDAVNVGQLNAVTGNVAALQTDVTANTAAIGTLQSNVAANTAQITTNTAAIGTLQTNVASNTAAIGTLQTDVATNTTAIGGLQTGLAATNQAVAAINANLSGFQNQLDDVVSIERQDRLEARRGVAAAVAMSEAPMPSRDGGISYSLHGAVYRGEYAIGGSVKYRINRSAALDVGVSHAGNSDTALRAGISGEF